MEEVEGWRAELVSTPVYKQKYAWLPQLTISGEIIWLTRYYRVYKIWDTEHTHVDITVIHGHRDVVGNITEADYIVRKLSESL